MTRTPGDDLSLDTTLNELVGESFVILSGADAIVARIPRFHSTGIPTGLRSVEAWLIRPGPDRLLRVELPGETTLDSLALNLKILGDRAVVAPPLEFPGRGAPRVRGADGTPIGVEELVEQARGPSAQRTRAMHRVDVIKAEYGRLLGSIGYRIECSALFDSAVPTTRAFETALALWADVTSATPEPEVVRRAGMVQVTFEAARAHAETIGYAHLPEASRPLAERGAKAARLAASTSSQAERNTALAQVVRILGELALPHLPDEVAARRTLTTGR
ncbi:MAG: hypothetical protein Q4F65_09025 [Propionibacteriaceae bacterium]|nr:hypothetical protein [Propionibacteriaceae bacterium]